MLFVWHNSHHLTTHVHAVLRCAVTSLHHRHTQRWKNVLWWADVGSWAQTWPRSSFRAAIKVLILSSILLLHSFAHPVSIMSAVAVFDVRKTEVHKDIPVFVGDLCKEKVCTAIHLEQFSPEFRFISIAGPASCTDWGLHRVPLCISFALLKQQVCGECSFPPSFLSHAGLHAEQSSMPSMSQAHAISLQHASRQASRFVDMRMVCLSL